MKLKIKVWFSKALYYLTKGKILEGSKNAFKHVSNDRLELKMDLTGEMVR